MYSLLENATKLVLEPDELNEAEYSDLPYTYRNQSDWQIKSIYRARANLKINEGQIIGTSKKSGIFFRDIGKATELTDFIVETIAEIDDYESRIQAAENLLRIFLAGFGDEAVSAIVGIREKTEPLMFAHLLLALGNVNTLDSLSSRVRLAQALVTNPDARISEAARSALESLRDIETCP